MKNETTPCLDCGMPMGSDGRDYSWTSHEKSKCISLLLARAETAEAKVVLLERDKQQLYEKASEICSNWEQAQQQVTTLRDAITSVVDIKRNLGLVVEVALTEALAATKPEEGEGA